jgi:hypothetical protein
MEHRLAGVCFLLLYERKETEMRKLLSAVFISAIALTTQPATAQSRADREYQRDVRQAEREYRRDVKEAKRERRQAIRDWRQYRRLDWNRPDPYYGRYDADRYYRDGRYYQVRRIGRNDRIYRGRDGRYYCRRPDGTTGLIIGGAVGGLLGNNIGRGDSKIIATIIGTGAGALLGREIERGNVRCR